MTDIAWQVEASVLEMHGQCLCAAYSQLLLFLQDVVWLAQQLGSQGLGRHLRLVASRHPNRHPLQQTHPLSEVLQAARHLARLQQFCKTWMGMFHTRRKDYDPCSSLQGGHGCVCDHTCISPNILPFHP